MKRRLRKQVRKAIWWLDGDVTRGMPECFYRLFQRAIALYNAKGDEKP